MFKVSFASTDIHNKQTNKQTDAYKILLQTYLIVSLKNNFKINVLTLIVIFQYKNPLYESQQTKNEHHVTMEISY